MFWLNPTTRSDALFASDLQASQHPDARQVRLAIRRTLRALGAHTCAARVAEEFGDHPETAVTRMCWARRAVCRAYPDPDTRRCWSLRLTVATEASAA
jgi:hypothetical protein